MIFLFALFPIKPQQKILVLLSLFRVLNKQASYKLEKNLCLQPPSPQILQKIDVMLCYDCYRPSLAAPPTPSLHKHYHYMTMLPESAKCPVFTLCMRNCSILAQQAHLTHAFQNNSKTYVHISI